MRFLVFALQRRPADQTCVQCSGTREEWFLAMKMERLKTIRGRIMRPDPTQACFTVIDDALLVVGADGRIESLGPAPSDCAIPTTNPEAIWMPGFVDTHVHFPQTEIIGRASGPLLDWLDQVVFPEEAKFSEAQYAQWVAERFCDALIAQGTTSAAVYSSSHVGATEILFSTFDRRGLRGLIGLTLMDQGAPDSVCLATEPALAGAEKLVSQWHGHDDQRLRFCVTPRFALSCSRELMRGAGDLSERYGLHVQTHIAENRAEIEAVRQAFPEATDYLGVYADHGLVTDRTLLAHCVWFDDPTWDRYALTGGAISHCPDSNFFLGSGVMNLDAPCQREIPVGLGSDVGAGRTFSMRRVVSSAYDAAQVSGAKVSAESLLWHATRGGAIAMGMATDVGCLEPGFNADVIAIRAPELTGSALFDFLSFYRDAGPVMACYVKGRRV